MTNKPEPPIPNGEREKTLWMAAYEKGARDFAVNQHSKENASHCKVNEVAKNNELASEIPAHVEVAIAIKLSDILSVTEPPYRLDAIMQLFRAYLATREPVSSGCTSCGHAFDGHYEKCKWFKPPEQPEAV